jgi:hypothetical protein
LITGAKLNSSIRSKHLSCLVLLYTYTMSSAVAKKRLQALSKQLTEGIPDEGTFEGIPKIRHVAGDSAGP